MYKQRRHEGIILSQKIYGPSLPGKHALLLSSDSVHYQPIRSIHFSSNGKVIPQVRKTPEYLPTSGDKSGFFPLQLAGSNVSLNKNNSDFKFNFGPKEVNLCYTLT